jgi:2-amino-4-hydroxy-6-hydroxymethyldihydropteridine diphosphokinase
MDRRTAYLALGANIGKKIANVRKAIAMIDAHEECWVTATSSIYETKPVGLTDQPDFVNMVIGIETTLQPIALLELCNEIEQKLGRKRTIRWGPRVIDIDILLYDGVNIYEDRLAIPHPRMMERAFVLVPLAEIAPGLELPGGISAREAAEQVERSDVIMYRE